MENGGKKEKHVAQTESPTPPPEPLISLDLGSNGGVIAPRTAEELVAVIQHEVNFWQFLQRLSGSHTERIQACLGLLNQALSHAQNARQREANNQGAATVQEQAVQAGNYLRNAFDSNKWPHSSTAIAIRAKVLGEVSPHAAAGYLFALGDVNQSRRFEPTEVAAWHGFIDGLSERYGTLVKGAKPARFEALTQLQGRAEKLLAQNRDKYEQLEREFTAVKGQVEAQLAEQTKAFDKLLSDSGQAQADALGEHNAAMAALQAAYREDMKLRAPIEYWTERKVHHEGETKKSFRWVLGSMAVLAAAVASGAHQVWKYSEHTDKPAGWMLAVLGVVALLGIWAVRLLVRLYLSHQHLATDAAERVTMAQTYLALVAEGKLQGADEDRRMVLQPLFRPAADGLVKDEGLPNPVLDFLTRVGRPG